MIMIPADCFRHVTGHFLYRCLRNKAVGGRDKDEVPINERLRLRLNAPLVSLTPTTAVNPDDDRMIAVARGSVDIEHLALRLRLGIGNIALNSGFSGKQRRCEK